MTIEHILCAAGGLLIGGLAGVIGTIHLFAPALGGRADLDQELYAKKWELDEAFRELDKPQKGKHDEN